MRWPTELNKLLDAGQVRSLLVRLDEHRALAAQVQQQLSPELREVVVIGAHSADRLTLVVPSPAWAARLRYMTPQLLQTLRGVPALQGLQAITVRVARQQQSALPEKSPTENQPSRRPALSPTTRAVLAATAEDLPDGPVREALRRLGRSQAGGDTTEGGSRPIRQRQD